MKEEVGVRRGKGRGNSVLPGKYSGVWESRPSPPWVRPFLRPGAKAFSDLLSGVGVQRHSAATAILQPGAHPPVQACTPSYWVGSPEEVSIDILNFSGFSRSLCPMPDCPIGFLFPLQPGDMEIQESWTIVGLRLLLCQGQPCTPHPEPTYPSSWYVAPVRSGRDGGAD